MSPNVINKKLLHEICNAYMYMILKYSYYFSKKYICNTKRKPIKERGYSPLSKS